MVHKICLNCGHEYVTTHRGKKSYVESCSQCSVLFPREYIPELIQDFLK